MRTYWRGKLVDYAWCRPGDLRLAVPGGMAQVLPNIMRNFPLVWARASNAGYFQRPGAPEGVVAEGGTVWVAAQTPGRPTLVAFPDRAYCTNTPTKPEVEAALLAITGGPMLVDNSQPTDLGDLLVAGQYSGFTADSLHSQVALGITPDHWLLHLVGLNMSLRDLQAFFVEMGCVQAIKFDGGGSTTLMENSKPTMGVVDPSKMRAIPNALVLLQVHTRGLVLPAMAVVDPGHGDTDPGAVGAGGVKESELTIDMAERVRVYGSRAGVQVVLTRNSLQGPTISERVAAINKLDPACVVLLHCNSAKAASAHGVETFYWHNSPKGRDLATRLLDRVTGSTALARRPYAPKAVYLGVSGYYQLLRKVDAPAALIEVGFVSNPSDLAYLSQQTGRVVAAVAMATAISDWMNVHAIATA
jgi:N-acetylmuramoyl-L-alanine amidase